MTMTYERVTSVAATDVCRSTMVNMEGGREYNHAAFKAWKYSHYFEFDSVKRVK